MRSCNLPVVWARGVRKKQARFKRNEPTPRLEAIKLPIKLHKPGLSTSCARGWGAKNETQTFHYSKAHNLARDKPPPQLQGRLSGPCPQKGTDQGLRDFRGGKENLNVAG